MYEAFIGEIRMFAGGRPPRDWAFCNGQLRPINQNQALFSLLGTTFGGDGKTNFALPNMTGRAPMGWGQAPGMNGHQIGELGETGSVAKLKTAAPNSDADQALASSGPSANGDELMYPPAQEPLVASEVNFIICMNGIFPPRA
jgi:microcystin-dependent protein